jgi:uncharacterized membrane protein YqiK
MTENQTQAAPDAIRAALDHLTAPDADRAAAEARASELTGGNVTHAEALQYSALARLAALEAVAEAARDCRDTLAVLPDCAALLDSLADLDT